MEDARKGELVLDVSEADVARVFPRVVSHRVRVRGGPEEEVLSSAVCSAVDAPGSVSRGSLLQLQRETKSGKVVGERGEEGVDRVDGWERKTVKDILVEILMEV